MAKTTSKQLYRIKLIKDVNDPWVVRWIPATKKADCCSDTSYIYKVTPRRDMYREIGSPIFNMMLAEGVSFINENPGYVMELEKSGCAVKRSPKFLMIKEKCHRPYVILKGVRYYFQINGFNRGRQEVVFPMEKEKAIRLIKKSRAKFQDSLERFVATLNGAQLKWEPAGTTMVKHERKKQ